MKYGPETPFETIESAQQFVELLIEAINESRHDVDADIALSRHNGSERNKKALQLVSANLAKLNEYMTTSRRILNHLRTLRRLLLEERPLKDARHTESSNRQLIRSTNTLVIE